MSKQKRRGQVPALRFPEFRHMKEWELHRIEEVCERPFSGGTPTTSNKKYYGGEIPFIRSAEIDKDKTELFLTEEGLKNSSAKLVNKGDVLVALYGANSGEVALGKIQGAINQAVLCLRSKASNAFLYQYLSHKKEEITARYLQGGQGNLSGDIIKSIEMFFPEPDEQQKIADCLTSIDELIAAQTRRIDALKIHKSGLMQQLFTSEGETVPPLRFPEFQDKGEWQEKALGDFGDVQMCKRIFAEQTNNESGVPFYKIGTLGDKPDAFINYELFEEYRSKYKFPRKGEILITCSGTVGKCLAYDGKDAYYQDSNIVWIDNPTLEIVNEFLHCLLLRVDWGQLNSTTITRIYGSDLRSLRLVFPADQKEQQKISDCLASIDELITAHSQKIDALKAHKKGLLQQLLPAIDEEDA